MNRLKYGTTGKEFILHLIIKRLSNIDLNELTKQLKIISTFSGQDQKLVRKLAKQDLKVKDQLQRFEDLLTLV